jgi:polynucleotide 5'-kinase involved in rRNA processing
VKVLEIQDGKLTLEYQDGSIGSVESREHTLLVVRALNSIEPDSVLTNHEAENVRIAIMVAFKDVSSLEVHETHNEPGVVMSRQEYRQRLVDEMVSKIVSTSHENNETHTIHLVRGIGGSGKTTYANTLQEKLSIRTLSANSPR